MSKENDGRHNPDHTPGTRKGEEQASKQGKEPGRHDHGSTHADRPAGKSTARDSTSVNADAENPIDPKSPKLPPA